MFALIDVNSCYASCEAIFRPDLRDKPIVVLSNNDGCIVARNKQAKSLGIPDITPYFQLRGFLEKHQVQVFSSNYELYGDISLRIMRTIRQLAGNIEVYSIDEAFADCSDRQDLHTFGKQLRDILWKEQRVSVGVGIAPTKTLAKLANHAAKKIEKTGGVCVLDQPHKWQWLLARVPTASVWGVGRRLSQSLAELGIHTAADLAAMPPTLARQKFSVVLSRTIRELNGEPSIDIDTQPQTKQQIICSRSFARKTDSLADMQQAVVHYGWRASEKLRQQGSMASMISVWITTGRHTQPTYSNSTVCTIPGSSADGRHICRMAKQLLKDIYRPGFRYAKAGVGLMGLHPANQHQQDLFNGNENTRLMQVMDSINRRYRKQTVVLAGQGFKTSWSMTRNMLSPAYTTRWSDIPHIRCRDH